MNGEYFIELHVSGKTAGPAQTPELQIVIDGAALDMGAISNTSSEPAVFRFSRNWTTGRHTIHASLTNFENNAIQNTSNNMIIHGGHISSAAFTDGPGKGLLNCDLQEASCYQNALINLAERAYRRPLTVWQERSLRAVYVRLLESESKLDAFKFGVRAVLMSPEFLYHTVRKQDITDPQQIDAFVLANRLSYFLWSSMPDQQLIDAAASGALMTKAGLDAEVDRMLGDPKIQGFIDSFAEQWLALRLFDKSRPDPGVYPLFNNALASDIRAESKAFFNYFLTNNVPLKEMANPGVAFLTDRLAQHYGMTEPGSNTITRVPASGSDRRGLFELSAWLIAESEANRTSPIRRANWVLDRFICDPVAPPPPSVDASFPQVSGELSIREIMAIHRENESCAACHDKLDPVGLIFENLDGIVRDLSLIHI